MTCSCLRNRQQHNQNSSLSSNRVRIWSFHLQCKFSCMTSLSSMWTWLHQRQIFSWNFEVLVFEVLRPWDWSHLFTVKTQVPKIKLQHQILSCILYFIYIVIWEDFQVCIIVPLRFAKTQVQWTYHFHLSPKARGGECNISTKKMSLNLL